MAVRPFVLLVGATASGKSALAENLATHFSGAILNCDSLQVYKRLDIGTAKPEREVRQRIPHLLFDIVPPGEILTAGDFRKLALSALERELPQRIVFGVGGSGFYIQALEKGMFEIEKPAPEIDLEMRTELKKKGLPHMYQRLCQLDPEYAQVVNPNDAYRVVRALVMILDSGKTVTALRSSFRQQPFPFPILKLGIEATRAELLPRVELRVEQMLAAGFLQEVRDLHAEGFSDWPPLQSVGYKECLMHLRGEITKERLKTLIVEKTLQLAKKQRTWFKRDSEIHWLPMANLVSEAVTKIDQFSEQIRGG